jgi:molybdenum cofactor guanylyltransferase
MHTDAGCAPPRPDSIRGQVTAIILCGGRGSRLEGRDKPLTPVLGRPLVEWLLARLSPQVSGVVISANRHGAAYARYGHPVVADEPAHRYQGPLAGMHAGLARCDTRLALVCAGDAPLVPPDLVTRLGAGLDGTASVAVAHDGERWQPALLLDVEAAKRSLPRFLESGGRALFDWAARQPAVMVDFSDRRGHFFGLNSADDIDRLTALLRAASAPRAPNSAA